MILNLVTNAVDAMREATGGPRRLFIALNLKIRSGAELQWRIEGKD